MLGMECEKQNDRAALQINCPRPPQKKSGKQSKKKHRTSGKERLIWSLPAAEDSSTFTQARINPLNHPNKEQKERTISTKSAKRGFEPAHLT